MDPELNCLQILLNSRLMSAARHHIAQEYGRIGNRAVPSPRGSPHCHDRPPPHPPPPTPPSGPPQVLRSVHLAQDLAEQGQVGEQATPLSS